ncbi:MAG: 5'/3'-nucleotidase SurE [Haliscomenobacter sp.]|uniref:5'/3'-nucleotidase SurE n=1 Tax=Haliscomenobacter sp. TaxID=2717303 RepID=UPI0029B4BD04|nr:5'/3'-nucleotidase SurE [Haliscomenobacter sp.]MDX2068997.1 5'/3'-nucleotidase SurE [Haliscomenobacter sp.]
MKKPLILVTNDDGIAARGIKTLIDIAKQIGDVIVVAPDSPQSGQGHAITLEHPLRLYKVDLFEGVEAYECSGTPVDCVKLAKNVLLKDRELHLCVSGINHGSNASINIIYSGTMSAAMEASLEGVPSIGFSFLNYSPRADFSATTPYVKGLMEYVLEHGMSKGTLWNVNLPDLPSNEIKGVKTCRQADSKWVEEFVEATDPRGQKYYWLTGRFVNEDDAEDTDIWALENGYISVVPSKHDLTNYEALAELTPLEALFK